MEDSTVYFYCYHRKKCLLSWCIHGSISMSSLVTSRALKVSSLKTEHRQADNNRGVTNSRKDTCYSCGCVCSKEVTLLLYIILLEERARERAWSELVGNLYSCSVTPVWSFCNNNERVRKTYEKIMISSLFFLLLSLFSLFFRLFYLYGPMWGI